MARYTRFSELPDGRVQRQRSDDGDAWWAVGDPFDAEEMRPREEDAYPLESPPHIEGCRGVPVGPAGIGIVCCAEGCPELARTLERAEQVACEHGWV